MRIVEQNVRIVEQNMRIVKKDLKIKLEVCIIKAEIFAILNVVSMLIFLCLKTREKKNGYHFYFLSLYSMYKLYEYSLRDHRVSVYSFFIDQICPTRAFKG